MTVQRAFFQLLAAVALSALPVASARAICDVTSFTSVSPTTHALGTYTGTTVPGTTTRTLTINFMATGNGGGNCRLRLFLRRTAAPAELNTSPASPVPLPYSASIDGVAMRFAASPAVSPTGGDLVTVPSPNSSTPVARSGTTSISVTPGAVSGAPWAGTGYVDNVFIDLYYVPQGSTTRMYVGTMPFSFTAIVSQSCSITSPANVAQVVAVNSVGLTSGMATASPSFNVLCTGASNVTLSTLNGAVTLGGVAKASLTPISGFRKAIDYSASINGGAGAISLNTASATSATGTFNNSPVTTTGTQVTITPATSSVPLVAGSYSDTLTVSILPQ